MNRPTFFIIDGHSQIYRCFYAKMANLTAPDGEPTKATYVFTKFLITMLQKFQPTYVAMAVDGERKKLARKKIHPGYKSKRQGAPNDILCQVDRIIQIVKLLGIPILRNDEFEADDIIATLVDCCPPDVEAVIVSRDKDLMQLVNENQGGEMPTVKMYDPLEQEWWDYDRVQAKWGCPPALVLDMQILLGDDTDDVDGIPGLGPKSALKLLDKYGSVENVLRHRAELPEKFRAHLTPEYVEFNRSLVGLSKDVPIDIDPAALRFRGLDMDKAKPIFRMLGFKRWE